MTISPAPKEPVPKPNVPARISSAAQIRHSSSRGKRKTIRFVMFRSTISQRASTSTKRPMRYRTHASSRPKTTVRTPLKTLEKRFSRTHARGATRRCGGSLSLIHI